MRKDAHLSRSSAAALCTLLAATLLVTGCSSEPRRPAIGCVAEVLQQNRSCLTAGAPGWRDMKVGECMDAWVDAAIARNATGVIVAGGSTYAISVVEEQEPWTDWWIRSSPESGWTGAARIIEPVVRWGAVDPGAPMFTLLARLDESPPFRVGAGTSVTPPVGGRLYLFANDWPVAYANNRGCLQVRVKRTSE